LNYLNLLVVLGTVLCHGSHVQCSFAIDKNYLERRSFRLLETSHGKYLLMYCTYVGGYYGGSPKAVQAWRPCPLWEPSHPQLSVISYDDHRY